MFPAWEGKIGFCYDLAGSQSLAGLEAGWVNKALIVKKIAGHALNSPKAGVVSEDCRLYA